MRSRRRSKGDAARRGELALPGAAPGDRRAVGPVPVTRVNTLATWAVTTSG
jgi:hypothetical protein